MTSDYFPFSKTQCAVFKGTDRTVFLDKREFTGPIYEQIEEAVDFVLRNIRLGAAIDGLIRTEKYELPIEAIREMIINAHCHRNLLDESCIQVAIYDDRLEVTSPGGLYNGLTYEEVMNGHSKIRNKGIANIFSQMGLVEAWGSGIKRIISTAEQYGLPKPRFQEFDNMFRVELFRNNSMTMAEKKDGEDSEKVRKRFGESSEKTQINELTDTQKKIVELLCYDKQLSAKKIAENFKIMYLDTGALYRAIGYYFIRNNLDYKNGKMVEENLNKISLDIKFSNGKQIVFINGEDVTSKIRTNEVSMAASAISSVKATREFLIDTQREIAKKNSVVMDGRDIGTVILPKADVKIFLTASLEERTRRRFEELNKVNNNIKYEEVFNQMRERDFNDTNRKVAPLRPAEDAVIFDSTKLEFEQVVSELTNIIKEKLK